MISVSMGLLLAGMSLYLTSPTPGVAPTPTPTYGAITGLRSNPFSPNATFSYEPIQGLVTANGLPINQLIPKRPAKPLIPISIIGSPASFMPMLNDLEEPTTPGVKGVYPWPPIVTDWASVKRIPLGIQLEGLDWYSMPPGAALRPLETLAYLRGIFQQINIALIRDAGVEVQIVSVHIMEFSNPDGDTDSGNTKAAQKAIQRFAYDLVMYERPKVVLRMGPNIGGGKAHQSGPCLVDGDRPLNVSRAWVDYGVQTKQDGVNDRNIMVSIIAQELTHHILGLGHAQCYYSPTDGLPIEQWNDGVCWLGENDCPLFTEQSYMGYAYGCATDYGGLKYPIIRIGPSRGPLAEVAHLHAQSYDCLSTIAYLPTDYSILTDTDHDAVPDPIDNCPLISNTEQEDSDSDTLYNSPSWARGGDACDSCATVRPKHGAWLLLLPILILRMWRKR